MRQTRCSPGGSKTRSMMSSGNFHPAFRYIYVHRVVVNMVFVYMLLLLLLLFIHTCLQHSALALIVPLTDRVLCVQVVLLSATMPADVLEVTKRFMREPVRILVKKEELTLEGIKQFYVQVEKEVFLPLSAPPLSSLSSFSPTPPLCPSPLLSPSLSLTHPLSPRPLRSGS